MPTEADDRPNRDHDRIVGFLRQCHRQLERLVADQPANSPARLGTTALAEALAGARPRSFESSWLPVLDSIDRLTPGPLVERFVDVAPRLRWIPTPRAADGGDELALAPLQEMLDLDLESIGLMYVGPGCTYPLHQHPPQELYLTMAGTGRWRYGGHDEFETVGPLQTLYNHPGDLHSAISDHNPLLALYVLW